MPEATARHWLSVSSVACGELKLQQVAVISDTASTQLDTCVQMLHDPRLPNPLSHLIHLKGAWDLFEIKVI